VELLNHSEDVASGNYQIFFVLKFDLITGEFSKDYTIPHLYILGKLFIRPYLNYLACSWLFLRRVRDDYPTLGSAFFELFRLNQDPILKRLYLHLNSSFPTF